MDRKKKALDMIIEQAVVPLYFHPDPETSMLILKSLYDAGSRVVEFSNRGKNAISDFLNLRKFVDTHLPDLLLGVGTVRNQIEGTEFINEGADFIICPGVIRTVAELADDNGVLWIPGCLTATEIIEADDLGAQIVKLFPGSLVGPDYLAAMKEIFPELMFMSTGGIETELNNLESWFRSGATAVGMGSKLVSKELVEAKDYAAIVSITRETLQSVAALKSKYA